MKIILSMLAVCFSTMAWAQTADDYIAQGRTYLGPTADNVWAAHTNFSRAVALSPTNETANALLAATRLLTVFQQPAGSNFLNQLGFPKGGRDLYNWTAQFPRDGDGQPVFPANYNSATAIAFLRTNLLPAMAASANNLAAVKDPNFTLFLPAAETTGISDVTLDYGDVQLLRALLAAGQFMGYTLNANNFSVVVPAIQTMGNNGTLTIQNVLSTYPNLLSLSAPADLTNSRTALTNAISVYWGASSFIRNQRPPDATRLFNLDTNDLAGEAEFSRDLTNVLASLNAPAVIAPERETFTVNAGNYFSGAHPLRSLMPKFIGDIYVNGSLPDYTFGSVLGGVPSYSVESGLRKAFPSYTGIYTGDGGVWDGYGYANGSVAVLVKTNGQGILMGHDDGDGSGDNNFGFLISFTVDRSGHWEVNTNGFDAHGDIGDDGSFYGEIDYTNGLSVSMDAYLESPLGPFANLAGYYRGGTFTATDNGTQHSGFVQAIVTAAGSVYYIPFQSSPPGVGSGGGPAQLDDSDQFVDYQVTGTIVSGVINPATFTMSGTLSGNITGSFNNLKLTDRVPVDRPPQITSPLASPQVVSLGGTANFQPGVTGSTPLSYQWHFNGTIISNATASSLVISNVQYDSAGLYTAVIDNVAGETNVSATLVVVPETVPPTNRIIAPAPGMMVSNASYTVSGSATDNVAVSNVWYQLNGGGWNAASTANGWLAWTAQVDLTPGTNRVQAFAVDTSGNVSATNTAAFVYIVSAPLTVNVNGGGTVTPNYNGSLLQIGVSYAMTAQTNPGSAFVNWTDGSGAVITAGATLQFVMASNLTFNANFTDIGRPTNQITAPVPGQRWSNAVFMVTGKAGDNVAVSNVFYSLNGGDWTAAGTANNWANWSALINPLPGSNSVAAYAVDASGNVSKTNLAGFIYVVSATLSVATNGRGTITPNYNNATLQIGVNYSMTAKAATGFSFANWTDGDGDLITNGATLKFTMASNLTFVANFPDATKPTLAITNPLVSPQRWSNLAFTVKGKTGDNGVVSNVWYNLNNSGWTLATPGINWSNWTAPITLAQTGNLTTNDFAAYAEDSAGNHSLTNKVKIIRVLAEPLAVTVAGVGKLSVANGQLLEIGKSVLPTATPGTGWVLTNWQVSVDGVPVINSNKITAFVMRTNTAVQVTFADITKPVLTVTAPVANQKSSNEVFTIRGKVTDSNPSGEVKCQLNNGGWLTATGWTNWSQDVSLVPGTNTVQVYAQDAAGNRSLTNTLKVVYVPMFTLAEYFPQPLNGYWHYVGNDWDGNPAHMSWEVTNINYLVDLYTGSSPVKKYFTNSLVMESAYLDPFTDLSYDDWQEFRGTNTSAQVVMYGDDDLPDESMRVDGGIKFPVQMYVGQSASVSGTAYSFGIKQGTLTLTFQLLGQGPLTVPAGTFDDVLHLRMTMKFGTSTQVKDWWWAKGVGQIKSQGISGGGSAMGFELDYYSLAALPAPAIIGRTVVAPPAVEAMAGIGLSVYAANCQFGFMVSGPSGKPMVIESSSNLLDWTPVETLTITDGPVRYSVRIDPDQPMRFYRVRSQ